MSFLKCASYQLDLSQAHIMAVINITPDSFSEDGLFGKTLDVLEQRAQSLIEQRASILDIGGESTRPNSHSVPLAQELERVIPVVERLAKLGVPISVDTVKPQVMQAAISAGASMINDISGFQDPEAMKVLAESDVAACIMHMQGQPISMQDKPSYQDIVSEVKHFLLTKATELQQHYGVAMERICLDPGFGFGKTQYHNYVLLQQLLSLSNSPYPVLVGMSRKSMIGAATGLPVAQRDMGSAIAAALAIERGAKIVRVHDVALTQQAVSIVKAVMTPEILLS